MSQAGSVSIWEADFRNGQVPKLSALSGVPAETTRKYTYRTAPGWTWAIIIAGILVGVGWIPGILIRLAVSKTAKVDMPLTERERTAANRKVQATWGLLLASLVAFVLSLVLPYPQFPTGLIFLLALLLFIAFAVALLILAPRIRPRASVAEPQPGSKLLTVRDVHPDFALAVSNMYSQRAVPNPEPPA